MLLLHSYIKFMAVKACKVNPKLQLLKTIKLRIYTYSFPHLINLDSTSPHLPITYTPLRILQCMQCCHMTPHDSPLYKKS